MLIPVNNCQNQGNGRGGMARHNLVKNKRIFLCAISPNTSTIMYIDSWIIKVSGEIGGRKHLSSWREPFPPIPPLPTPVILLTK